MDESNQHSQRQDGGVQTKVAPISLQHLLSSESSLTLAPLNASPVLLVWFRWLRQMGEVQETPIISYMQSATADPVEQLQTLEQPRLSQALMSQAQVQNEEPEGSPDRGTGGYRLTFNTSPRCFSGTNAQVSQHALCSFHYSRQHSPAQSRSLLLCGIGSLIYAVVRSALLLLLNSRHPLLPSDMRQVMAALPVKASLVWQESIPNSSSSIKSKQNTHRNVFTGCGCCCRASTAEPSSERHNPHVLLTVCVSVTVVAGVLRALGLPVQHWGHGSCRHQEELPAWGM